MPKFDTSLPVDFDGTFRFTNRSEEEFVAKWDGKEYKFPPMSTSPMMIPTESPLGIQQIRKKFARNWAEREFFKSDKGKALEREERNIDGTARMNSIHMARTYSEDDLAPYIQMCLEPLPEAKAIVVTPPKENIEDKLNRDEDGEIITKAIDKNTSLRKKVMES